MGSPAGHDEGPYESVLSISLRTKNKGWKRDVVSAQDNTLVRVGSHGHFLFKILEYVFKILECKASRFFSNLERSRIFNSVQDC